MSKDVVNVQMEWEFYDSLMSGGQQGGDFDNLIYFDIDILYEALGSFELDNMVMMLLPYGSVVAIVAEYGLSYEGGEKGCFPVRGFPLSGKYLVTNNQRGVAEDMILGSGGLGFLNMDYTKSITLYEFLEMVFNTRGQDGSDIIKGFKSAEVSKEEVMQWLQTPVEE